MNTNVSTETVVTKRYLDGFDDLYRNEKYFYQNYPEFCPKLIGYNDEALTLVLEKGEPILEVDNNIRYRDALYDLVSRLHEAGANHRDIALCNVVIINNQPLLIDWESATEDIGEVSIDLYGHVAAGIKPPEHWDYGENGIWWNEPWDICPGKYWK